MTNTPEGISSTLYQKKGKKWRPVDHISSTLRVQKKRLVSQIYYETLGLTYGIDMFWPYLVGSPFYASVD